MARGVKTEVKQSDLFIPDGMMLVPKRETLTVMLTSEVREAINKNSTIKISASIRFFFLAAVLTKAEYKKRLAHNTEFRAMHAIWKDQLLEKLSMDLPPLKLEKDKAA